jgi:hypothetical protein
MKVECPYCNASDYEIFDEIGGDGQDIEELCTCFECDKIFRIVYSPVSIEKDA